MGLNYVRRPPREDLGPINIFIAVSLGDRDLDFAENDIHLIKDFENKQLDRAEEVYRNLRFDE